MITAVENNCIRHIMKYTLLTLVLSFLLISNISAETGQTVAGPYLQPVTRDAVAVLWMTEEPAVAWVQYAAQGEAEKKVMASEHGLVPTRERIHKVLLRNLAPGGTYTYRVCWQEMKRHGEEPLLAGPFTFHLPAADADCSFAVFSDIHGNTELLQKLAGCAGVAEVGLIALAGDMMDSIMSEKQIIRDVLTPMTALTASSIPFVWVRGNHETRGLSAYRMADYLAMPDGHYYYTFQWGPVFFIVLDTGEDKPDNHPEYMGLADFEQYGRVEREWAARVLASEECRQAPFRVVLMHITPINNGRYEEWADLLNSAAIDLVIGGHYHDAGIHEPENTPLNCVNAQCGGREEGDGAAIRVDIEDGSIHVRVINTAGRVIAEKTIQK